jgi:hypothetical protein
VRARAHEGGLKTQGASFLTSQFRAHPAQALPPPPRSANAGWPSACHLGVRTCMASSFFIHHRAFFLSPSCFSIAYD